MGLGKLQLDKDLGIVDVSGKDYAGSRYPDVCVSGITLRTIVFEGVIHYQRVMTAFELQHSFRYGKYLMEQGYEFFVMGMTGEDFFIRMAWYLDHPASGERIFAIKFGKRLLESLIPITEMEAFNNLQQAYRQTQDQIRRVLEFACNDQLKPGGNNAK